DLRRYEISNFARAGFESAHNLKYWHRESYLGFGSDAHSFDGKLRWRNVESPPDYVEAIERGDSPRESAESANATEEKFFVGLRLASGIRPEAGEWDRFRAPIDRLIAQGLMESDGDTLRLTNRGILFSNEVFEEFIEI
ncbi:MAG: radical SAM family heme chaperone HemW, partial [Bryobacteraceae bacterium]